MDSELNSWGGVRIRWCGPVPATGGRATRPTGGRDGFRIALVLVAGIAWLGASGAHATPTAYSDFAIYGAQGVSMERHPVSGAPVGSGGDILVNTSDVPGIYSVGNAEVNGSMAAVGGDIVAMGTVDVTPNHDILGSIHSSAPAGTRPGAEVVGPATSSISGDVVARGDVNLDNVLALGGSVHSEGDLQASLNGTVAQDARANGSVYLGWNVHVSGDVVYGTTLNQEPSALVSGGTSQGSTVVSPETFSAVGLPTPSIFAGGVGVVDEAGTSLADPLAPGTYGTLEADDIFLTGGTYVFSAIDVAKNADLYLDLSGGPIEIFVEGDAIFGGTNRTLEVFVSDDGIDEVDMDDADASLAANVWLETHGTFRANRLSEWFGSIYAPYEGIDGGKLEVIGALYAGGHVDGDPSEVGIDLQSSSGFYNHVFVAPNFVPIPEPGVALLLTLGLVGVGGVRRLKRRRTDLFL